MNPVTPQKAPMPRFRRLPWVRLTTGEGSLGSVHLRWSSRLLRCAGCAGYRKDGGPRGSLRLLLRFHFAHQHGGSHGAYWNGARLRAAFAIEDFALVACGEDGLHCGTRCAYDTDAAN